jgi:prepilin-type N-terminal cleavage/methylation domain-containing protein
MKKIKKALHKLKKIFRGFTIVELIVVIAIIAVLSGIILVSLSSYSGKSRDSKVKAEISEVAKGAVLYFDNYGTYDGYTLPDGIDSACSGSSYTLLTNGASSFIVYAKLCTNSSYWCRDSFGVAKQIDSPPGEGILGCVTSESGGLCGGSICDSGYTCWEGNLSNSPVCSVCNSNGSCDPGEDCRCSDCDCTTEGQICCDSPWGDFRCNYPHDDGRCPTFPAP